MNPLGEAWGVRDCTDTVRQRSKPGKLHRRERVLHSHQHRRAHAGHHGNRETTGGTNVPSWGGGSAPGGDATTDEATTDEATEATENTDAAQAATSEE